MNCGYDFAIYSYGPFDSQLLADLDVVEHFGCVSVRPVFSITGGYAIRPSENVDAIRDKAAEFLDSDETKKALDELVVTYGRMTAKDLELRATTVYVARNLRDKGKLATRSEVCHLVGQIKPRFSNSEICQAVDELKSHDHIRLAA